MFARIGGHIVSEFDRTVANDKQRYELLLENQAVNLGTTRAAIDADLKKSLH